MTGLEFTGQPEQGSIGYLPIESSLFEIMTPLKATSPKPQGARFTIFPKLYSGNSCSAAAELSSWIKKESQKYRPWKDNG